jgi:hypothetical protein
MPRGVRTDRISERDLQVLEFVARFGIVPRDAVALWADTGRAVTQARERRLRIAGLIYVLPRFGPSGPFVVATRAGIRACGRLELRPGHPSYAELVHQGHVARMAARLERSGAPVLSEREMLARERAEGERVLSAKLSNRRYHRADLLRLGGGGGRPQAIEVELAVKGARRLDEIVRAWRRAVAEGKVSGVVYHCSPAARRALLRSVARTRASAQVQIELLRVNGESGARAHPPEGSDGPPAAAIAPIVASSSAG